MTIPVVEEDLVISIREVERGTVRIYSRVTAQPVEEAVRLRAEKITVERRPADRPATDADFAAAAQEVIELTETVEEPVIRTQARVVEEVVVQQGGRRAHRDGAGDSPAHRGGGPTRA